ncbi:hypothetical protein KM176_06835 [Pseudooceanicola sp. CBS1P-1]|uniref:4-vinyl reductase 4VR domain-containing protein n=1 Tax=Pseudooceanicola albus TaxID=2692189 RepID=A0A6L7G013_9RHOB|nr:MULTISPECIES: V4R domain-containing protein [Pseudooceanicola]MBT9383566.1 hypothetical protein [Pseudooceanicola endophyticus]MXN17421.1 hypothetical protein [Pseudooceanicola albus]
MDLSQTFHQRLAITPDAGEMRDGAIRYLMMRPDALMGMFARLSPAARQEAVEALCASVAEFGGKSVKAYRDSGAVDPDAMMKTIADTSGELGWGIWTFGAVSADRIDVQVRNSPFAMGIGRSDQPVCGAIRGILTAIGPLLLNAEAVRVEETSCHAMTGTGICHFTLSR